MTSRSPGGGVDTVSTNERRTTVATAPPDEIEELDTVLKEMKIKLLRQLENPHLDKHDIDLLQNKLDIISSVS